MIYEYRIRFHDRRRRNSSDDIWSWTYRVYHICVPSIKDLSAVIGVHISYTKFSTGAAMVFEETLVGDKHPVYHIPNIAAGASKFIKVVDNFF